MRVNAYLMGGRARGRYNMDIELKGEVKRAHGWKLGELFRFQAGTDTYMVIETRGERIVEYISLTNYSAGIKYRATDECRSFVHVRQVGTLVVEVA